MQAPKAKLTKSIDQLARSINAGSAPAAVPEETKAKKGKGLFSFLGSGSK